MSYLIALDLLRLSAIQIHVYFTRPTYTFWAKHNLSIWIQDEILTHRSSDPRRFPCRYTCQLLRCTPAHYSDCLPPNIRTDYRTQIHHTSKCWAVLTYGGVGLEMVSSCCLIHVLGAYLKMFKIKPAWRNYNLKARKLVLYQQNCQFFKAKKSVLPALKNWHLINGLSQENPWRRPPRRTTGGGVIKIWPRDH